MGPVRHLFLINPHAGKYDRTQEMREKLRTALAGRDEPWEAAVTQYPGHGAEPVSYTHLTLPTILRV